MIGIYLPEYQIRAALDGRLKQFTKPLKEQPIDILPMNIPGKWIALMTKDPNSGCVFSSRYKTSVQYYVKETYVYTTSKENCVYKVDCKDRRGDFWRTISEGLESVSWLSPVTMPAWAARLFITPTEILVRRVQELDEGDFIFEGCPNKYLLGKNWFIPTWNKQYPKTPWESNPWVATYKVDVEVKK